MLLRAAVAAAAIVCSSAIALAAPHDDRAPQGQAPSPPSRVSPARPGEAKAQRARLAARRVYVGVYLTDISNFDLTTGRFNADLVLWVKWLGDERIPPVALSNAEVANRVLLAREADGDWRSARWRVQTTLRGVFPLHNFPFDRQKLRVEVELPKHEGKLVPDAAGSGMSKSFSITGWLYKPYFKTSVASVIYHSDFGSVVREGVGAKRRRVTFLVALERPVLPYVLRFMLPLGIILAMATLAFFVRAHQIGVRGSIGVTALLSSVAFQFSQSKAVPDVSYLMTVDKVFLASYVIILLCVIESVTSHNLVESHPKLSRRIDLITAAVIPLAAVVTGLMLMRAPPDSASATTDGAPKRGSAKGTARAPAVKSSQDELRVSIVRLRNLATSYVRDGLLRRGLTHTVRERRGAGRKTVAHLARAVPRLTNDLVRFLPDGGMVVRWALRPGLRWSDGSAITSSDLAYSAALRKRRARRAVKVVDALTIEITFNTRVGRNLAAFPLYPRAHIEPIVKKGGIKALDKWLDANAPPGDGPYRIAKMVKGEYLLLERNPHFAGVAPAIGHVRFIVNKKRGPVANEIIAGRAHLASLIGPLSYGILAKSPKGAVRSDRYDRLYILQPDLSHAPFGDVRVRRALAHAIDRRAAGAHVFGTAARVAHAFRPRWAKDYERDVKRYAHDPKKARALLAEAGLKTPLKVAIIARRMKPGAPERDLLERIVKELPAAGFEATINWHKGSSFRRWAAGKHQGLLYYTRSGSNPVRYFNVPYAKGRYAAREPSARFGARLVAMQKRWQTSIYVERRVAVSRQMQKIFAEQLPLVPLFFGQRRSGFAAGLSGWDPTGGSTPWWNVEHWYFK